MRLLIRLLGALAVSAVGLILASIAIFVAGDQSSTARRWLGLADRIPYFALRHFYVPDPTLVFAYRGPATFRTTIRGDLASSELGVPIEPRPYVASYTRDGLRVNSRPAPYDVVAVGDSFLEIGENDQDTLTERLASRSGRSVANLGVAWYGPFQYVELLRRHGPGLKPSIAALFFFEGNDLEDIQAYVDWRTTGRYYFYRDVSTVAWPARFGLALSDTREALHEWWRGLRAPRPRPGAVHPEVARVRLGGRTVEMRFGYWSPLQSPDALRASPAFGELERLLREFQTTASALGSQTLVVFVPTKISVYGPLVEPDSGHTVLSLLTAQRAVGDVVIEAVRELAGRLQLPFVDLRFRFRALAQTGELLYYPFDTHWNDRGREAAASILTDELRNAPLHRKAAGRRDDQ